MSIFKGDEVTWEGGKGKVISLYSYKVTLAIGGKEITREGKPQNAVALIQKDDGERLALFVSELTKADAIEKVTLAGEVLSEQEFDKIANISQPEIDKALESWGKDNPGAFQNILDV